MKSVIILFAYLCAVCTFARPPSNSNGITVIGVGPIESRHKDYDAYKVSLINKIIGDHTFQFKLVDYFPKDGRLTEVYEVVVGESTKQTYGIHEEIKVTVSQDQTLVWELQPVSDISNTPELHTPFGVTVEHVKSRDEEFEAYKLSLKNKIFGDFTFSFKLSEILPHELPLAEAFEVVAGESAKKRYGVNEVVEVTVAQGHTTVWELQPVVDKVEAVSNSMNKGDITVKQVKSVSDKFDAYELTIHNPKSHPVIYVFKLENHLPKDGRLAGEYEVVKGLSKKRIVKLDEKVSVITTPLDTIVLEVQPVTRI